MLDISPVDDYAHYGLGRALEKQGKQSEANGHYKLASSLRPQNEHYASRILDLDQEGDEPNEPDADARVTDADLAPFRCRRARISPIASNAVGGG